MSSSSAPTGSRPPTAPWGWLALIFVVALGLRVGVILVDGSYQDPQSAGAMEHRAIATQMIEGHGFSFIEKWNGRQLTSVQSPPYPTVLYLAYSAFGVDAPAAYFSAMVFNAVLGSLAASLTFLMAGRLGGDRLTGLLAAGLVAVWPTQVFLVTAAQAIAWITVAIVAATWLFYKSLDTGKIGPWVAFGLIGCLGALAEPVLLPPMAFTGLLIFVWKSKLTFKQRFRNAAILLGCAIVVLGPWTVRNYQVHEKFMPVKSTFWVNFWKANNPTATGTDRIPATPEQIARGEDAGRQYDTLTDAQKAELMGKNEVEREKIFQKWTTTWVQENPGAYVKMCFVRLGKTIWTDPHHPIGRKPAYLALRAAFLAFVALGVVWVIRQRWRLGMPALIAGCALLMYTLTITAARFTIPLEPFVMSFGAAALVGIGRRRLGTGLNEPVAEASA
ncbi:MAG: glycosyltransferase family 39 protein [Planctomycetota bacterium]